jgi:hypothetical protein
MPGWDVKVRPGKDEKKDDAAWGVVAVILLLLFILLLSGASGISVSLGCGGDRHSSSSCGVGGGWDPGHTTGHGSGHGRGQHGPGQSRHGGN